MKRIRTIKFSGFFIDRHHGGRAIDFNEKILINKDIDEIKQIKKHLDMKFKVNLSIIPLPNKQYQIRDIL